MTQSLWNHASDRGHGAQLSRSFHSCLHEQDTLAPLLILITTSEAQGSGAEGPGQVCGAQRWTGPEARAWRLQSGKGTSSIIRCSLPPHAEVASSTASLEVSQSLLAHLQGQELVELHCSRMQLLLLWEAPSKGSSFLIGAQVCPRSIGAMQLAPSSSPEL